MSETRRLAAILAADVVGYSRLMGDDEAGTARAVRDHREAATPLDPKSDLARADKLESEALALDPDWTWNQSIAA
jgi:hypothetical protein